jgi:acid phosphatase
VRPPRPLLAALGLLALIATACGATGTPHALASTIWQAKHLPARPTKVLIVVEENHAQPQALSQMPYLASLASTFGRTTAYHAVAHPSLPNYLAMAGGSTFGISDDRSPSSHPLSGPSAFDRVLASGRSAKTYAEAMPGNCTLSSTSPYAVRHNPWTYFADAASRAACRRFDVPAGTTAAGALRTDIDAGRLPTVGLLIPDLCHDAHNCSLATADSWLRGWLQRVLAGPDYRAGRLAVIVTFDEDDDHAANNVLTVVVSPYTRGITSSAPFTHYSLTRYIAELSHTQPLRAASTAPSLRTAFHI